MVNLRGQLGEEMAADYLQERGYVIVARNWRSRFGEVDIIARDGQTLAFIEVKTRGRKKGYFGTPLDAITPDKVRRLSRLAMDFGAQHNIDVPLRLDVVAISSNEEPELIRGIEPVDIG